MKRPFALNLKPNEAAMISECEGAYVIEPMRFLFPYQAKREASSKDPKYCWHNQRRESRS